MLIPSARKASSTTAVKFGVILGERFKSLQHRHLRAQATMGLGHFETNGTTADDDQMAGQSGVAENGFVGEIGHCVQAGNGGNASARARGNDDAASLIGGTACLDGLRADEFGSRADDGHAQALESGPANHAVQSLR